MSKRKQVEKYIVDMVYKITKSEQNKQLYLDLFKKMNDKEFKEFMEWLKDDNILNVIVPHDKGVTNITIENNMKVAKELGYDFFQYVFIGPTGDEPRRRSSKKYMQYILPFRRTKQTVLKGVSVSENDKKVDVLTGQMSGDSRSSRISYPEMQLLVGMGMTESVLEIASDRGGDPGAYRVLKQALLKYGKASRSMIEMYKEGVVSTQTLKSYFNGMHYKINLT